MEIFIKNTRLSFPQLWALKQMVDRKTGQPSGAPAASGNFLIPRSHPQVGEILDAIKAVAQEKWKGVDERSRRPLWEVMLEDFQATNRLCLHDGDRKRYDGYAGMLYISARSSALPLVVNRDPILRGPDGKGIWDEKAGDFLPNLVTEGSNIIYSGCYVNVRVDIWAQANDYGTRINATLKAVQFKGGGDAFAAGPPARAGDMEEPDLSEGAQEGAATAYQAAAEARMDFEGRNQAQPAQPAREPLAAFANKAPPPAAPARDPFAGLVKEFPQLGHQKAPDPRPDPERTQVMSREELMAKLAALDPSFAAQMRGTQPAVPVPAQPPRRLEDLL